MTVTMTFFRIEHDEALTDRWHLTRPLSPDGSRDYDFWPLNRGNRISQPEHPLRIDIRKQGQPLAFTLGKRPVISRGAQNRLPALWLKLERYELRVASVLASEAGVRELGSGGDASSKRGVT